MTTTDESIRYLAQPGMRDHMQRMIREAQDAICEGLIEIDGENRYREDRWNYSGGHGGGITRIFQDGPSLEKAGVNTSVVEGTLSREAAQAMGGGKQLTFDETSDKKHLDQPIPFFAAGISLVIHPRNPMAPTAHANYRYFELGGEGPECRAWWFGGGSDLTPSYLFDEDAKHFHETYKQICDRFDPTYYPRFKTWCDDYFLIAHRGERRGIGGIFFDNLHQTPAESLFQFCRACANAFSDAYFPILRRRITMPFDERRHVRWQQLRRGRYVEFNLVYDRGTTFGLKSGGRTESILMSLPLTARWEYDAAPEPDSDEARLLEVLKHPRAWT